MPKWRKNVMTGLVAAGLMSLSAGSAAAAEIKPAAAGGAAHTPADDVARAEAEVKANPGSAPAKARLGYLLLRKEAPVEALKCFDEALKLNPASHDAQTGRGAALVRQGKLEEAEQVLKEALLLNPNPVRTHYELGLLYERTGRLDKSIQEYREALRKYEQGR